MGRKPGSQGTAVTVTSGSAARYSWRSWASKAAVMSVSSVPAGTAISASAWEGMALSFRPPWARIRRSSVFPAISPRRRPRSMEALPRPRPMHSPEWPPRSPLMVRRQTPPS